MEYSYLGKSDLKVSALGFGCAQLGMHQWGEIDEKELGLTLLKSLDYGVNFFDTADVYGLGKSEENLQKYIGSKINDILISSKFGVRIINGQTVYDNSPKWINQAIDNSLKRLKKDTIDLYQIHYWDSTTPFETIFECLERLVDSGKIRYYGLSNIQQSQFDEKLVTNNLISFSHQYSLANRSHEKAIKEMQKENLGFISWGSLGEGILSGKYRSLPVFSEDDRRRREVYNNFHGESFERNMRIVNELEKISDLYELKSIPQTAIRWIIDYLNAKVVLVGIKNQEQLMNNLGAFGWKLTEEHITLLENISS